MEDDANFIEWPVLYTCIKSQQVPRNLVNVPFA